MSDLEQIINGEQPEPETPEPEPVVEQEAAEPEPTEPEPEKVEEPKAAEPEAQPTVPVAVVQELRQEIRELKALKAPPAPAPDVFEDPAGYQKHMQDVVRDTVSNVKLDLSEEMAREQFGDEACDKALAALQATQNPALKQSMMQARSPWTALVKWHQKEELAQKIGSDPEAYEAEVEAKVRQKIEAEMVAKQAADVASKAAPSMANVTGTGGGPRNTWAGPTPIENIIGD